MAPAQTGVDWLLEQAQADGRFAATSELATPFVATAEAVRTLRLLGHGGALGAAVGFLNGETYHGTRYLAQKIIANAEAGTPVPALVTELLAHQNADGGFGERPGHDSSVLQTAQALEALALAGSVPSGAIDAALTYLEDSQAADGSWLLKGNGPSVVVTALGLRAAWQYRRSHPVGGMVERAGEYLLAQRDAAGVWVEPFQSALSLIALVPSLRDAAPVASSIDGLRAARRANASWQDDVYTTALALRALAAYDDPATPSRNPDLAAIDATIVDDRTAQPLSGVSVELAGPTPDTLVTDVDGRVSFRDLSAPAQYTLSIRLSDYQIVSLDAAVDYGQAMDLGEIRLSKAADTDTGTIIGTVTDAQTGEPLAGALVAAEPGPSTTTTTDGGYQLSSVPQGDVILRAERAGYAAVEVTASVMPGGIQSFSPALRALPPAPVIQGVIVDAADGAPLGGVTVSLGGANTASTQTAADGSYRLTELATGTTSVTASATGYDPVSATVELEQATVLDFSPQLAASGTQSVPLIQGTVSDAGSTQALAGATVSLSGANTASTQTDAAGRYRFQELSTGPTDITVSLSGYEAVSGSTELGPDSVVEFSPALQREAARPLVYGQVTDIEGNPLAGAAVTLNGVNAAGATTDALGRYRLDGLSPGLTTISIALSGFVGAEATVEVEADSEVEFSPALEVEPTQAAVSGVVKDASDSQPLSGAEVHARQDARELTVLTDGDGRFLLEGFVPGEIRLNFARSGYIPVSLSVIAQGGPTEDLGEVRLRPEPPPLPDLQLSFVRLRPGAGADPQTLELRGEIVATVDNIGSAPAPAGVGLLAYFDANFNGEHDPGVDVDLGRSATTLEIAAGASQTLSWALAGALPFRDAPISVKVDPDLSLGESAEDNNIASTADLCRPQPDLESAAPELKWEWTHSGSIIPPLVMRTHDTNGDGLTDENDVPSVIFVSVDNANFRGVGNLHIVSGKDGSPLASYTGDQRTRNKSPLAAADLDGDGTIEIVGVNSGGRLVAFEHTGELKWVGDSVVAPDLNDSGGPSIADLDGDGVPEIVFGNTVSNADGTLRWRGYGPVGGNGRGSQSVVADLDLDGYAEVIAGAAAYARDGRLLWHNEAVVGEAGGYSAIGNFNEDPYPEIVVVSRGRLYLLDRHGELLWGPVGGFGGNGGPPAIADLTGDGVPEIVVAGSRLAVFHANGSLLWQTGNRDGSTETGATTFDFDGDGRAEVLFYGDADTPLRVYRGHDGTELWNVPNDSGTILDYPVVADVDADGHADVVLASSFHYGQLRGVRVFSNTAWMPARSLWNQHSYHISNINDDGSVPAQETPSWQAHNSYRSNRALDPGGGAGNGLVDLSTALLRVVDPGDGQPLSVSVRVGNGGLVASPAGVPIRFYEGDPERGGVRIGELTLDSIGPGQYQDVQLSGVTGLTGARPVHARVEPAQSGLDCAAANNGHGVFYGGQRPAGSLTVDRDVVASGDATVRASLQLRADAVSGALATVRDLITTGNAYLAPEARAAFESNPCPGCPVVSQTAYALNAALARGADVDAVTALGFINRLTSAQHTDGGLYTGNSLRTTRSLMGAWALSGRSGPPGQMLRSQYKAAQYLYAQRSGSNGRTFWPSQQQAVGWWRWDETHTLLGLKALVDLQRSVQAVAPGAVEDFAMTTLPFLLQEAHVAGGDIELGPDGKLYYIAFQHGNELERIRRVDLAAGTDELWVSLPADFKNVRAGGFAIDAAGTAFMATASGQVLRVGADKSVSVLYQDPTPGTRLSDVELAPDGDLYVSDSTGNRILRLSPDGAVQTLAAGAPLDQPSALAIDTAGVVYVANRGGFNIIRVTDDGASVHADGLASAPRFIAFDRAGDLFVTHESGAFPLSRGIYRVHPDGYTERLAESGRIEGLTTAGGRLLILDRGNRLRELKRQPLDTTQLDSMLGEIPRIVRWFLDDYDDESSGGKYWPGNPNSPGNVVLAARLIALGAARGVIADEALQAEMDTAMARLADLLRSRQNADGGWSHAVRRPGDPLIVEAGPSDAVVTALVGMGLDHVVASDDPAFMAALYFLMNAQEPDGSWLSAENWMKDWPRSGPTGVVLAYLPTAFGRLGGLDTEVLLHLPANIALSNPSLAPAAQAAADGGIDYSWHLPRVGAESQTIAFDLTLTDMQLHEERPVAGAAVLVASDAFLNDKPLRVGLDIPVVRADDGLRVALATDRASYGAQQAVTLSVPVSNTGAGAASGVVSLRIVAAADGALVAELAPQSFTELAAGAQRSLSFNWQTGTTRAGAYLAQASLRYDDGTLVDEAEAAFEIVAAEEGAPMASLRTSTDRSSYHTTDRVQIGSLARNLTSNYAIAGARLRIEVIDSAGGLVLAEELPLGELAPQAMAERSLMQSLSGTAEGSYRVQGTLLDGAGQALASAAADYTVREDRTQSIAGIVQAEARSLQQGDTQTCTDTVENRGTLAADGLGLRQMLVRLDVDTLVSTSESSVDLAPDASHRLVRAFGTGGLPMGDYACVLQAQTSGDWHSLGFAAFTVTEPPIRIDATLALGDKSRLLVLLDPPLPDARDPLGPDSGPDLHTQRAYLQSLLDADGWSYTIVTDADRFTQALRSGAYGVYAVLSETVKLGESVQVELREAVFRGEGLVEAGSHDQRNHRLDEALGVSLAGKHARATGVEFLPGPLSAGGYAEYPVADETLRARLAGAATQATVSGSPALTTFDYGDGRSVYAGFDLLVQATAAGEGSLFAELLGTAPLYTQPPLDPLKNSRVVPLRLQLVNEGVAVTGQVIISLPPGSSVADAGAAETGDAGELIWSYSLAEDETATLSTWLRLPSGAGPTTVHAAVQVEQDEALHEHTTAELVLEVSASGGLDQALDALRAVSASGSERAAFRKVQRELEAAQADIEAGDYLAALDALVRAATELARLEHPEAPRIRAMVAEAMYQIGVQL